MRKKQLFLLLIPLLLISLLCPQRADAITTRLRVGFNMHQAPYHFVDENGNAVGMHIDMLNHIAKQGGYELEYFPMETGTDCMTALDEGDIDMALVIKERYPANQWLSDTLSEEILCLLTKKTEESTDDRRVAVFQLGTLSPRIMSRLRAANAFPVNDQKVALQYLFEGRANVMVGLKESVLHYMPEDPEISDLFTIESNYVDVVNFGLMVRENDNSLLWMLNHNIATMRAGREYSDIRQLWSYQSQEAANLKWLSYLAIGLSAVVVLFVLYTVVATRIRRALRAQVDKQGLALQQANQEILQRMAQLKSESDIRNRIIRYSHLGMVLFDHEYNVKLVNDNALVLAGVRRAPGDVREMPVFRDIILACGESLSRGDSGEGAQIITLENNRVESRYRYTVQHLLCPGQAPDVLLTVENITNEEARRNALFEAEKNKVLNQVVASIAHEIKNPLTAIKTYAALLTDANNVSDPDFISDFGRCIPSEVERINRLVESLISYAKPAKGIIERLDLSALVWEAVFFAQSARQHQQISIESNIEKEHFVTASRDQLKQVLINITMNGIESMREKLAASPEKAPLALTISLQGDEEASVISIRDQGTGMSKNAIARCMDPFFTTKRTGTGLGLTLSKQYVQNNNGRLEIISEAGEYTEILITFRRESV